MINEKKKAAGIEKPKLEQCWKVEAISFIDPNDMEFKEPMKNARKKLESPMEAAMPCKVQIFRHGDPCGENKPNSQIKKCMHRRSSRIHENALGKDSTKKS